MDDIQGLWEWGRNPDQGFPDKGGGKTGSGTGSGLEVKRNPNSWFEFFMDSFK